MRRHDSWFCNLQLSNKTIVTHSHPVRKIRSSYSHQGFTSIREWQLANKTHLHLFVNRHFNLLDNDGVSVYVMKLWVYLAAIWLVRSFADYKIPSSRSRRPWRIIIFVRSSTRRGRTTNYRRALDSVHVFATLAVRRAFVVIRFDRSSILDDVSVRQMADFRPAMYKLRAMNLDRMRESGMRRTMLQI